MSDSQFSDIPVVMFEVAYPPPVVGGKEKQAKLLSDALIRRGVEVAVLSFRHGPAPDVSQDGPHVRRFRKGILGTMALLTRLIWLRRRFRILHVHTPSRIGILAAVVGQCLGYRVVFKLPNEGLVSAHRGFLPRIRVFLARRIHTIVCLEPDSARRLRDAGVSARRIFEADNGITIETGQDDRPCSTSAARRAGNGRFEFLFVGRLVEQKRCNDAIAAFKLSGMHESGAVLRIAGDGPLRGALERLVAEEGLCDSVIFEGAVPQPSKLMEQANCLLLCSSKEGMPNVVLEAMLCGLPVIATRVGAVERMLGDEAMLFDVGDVRELSSLMKAVAQDPSRANQYAQALALECRRRFNIDVIAESYISRYRERIQWSLLR